VVDHDDPVAGLLEAGDRARLEAGLGRARDYGFLGPGPVGDHLDRSLAMVAVVVAAASARRAAGRGGDTVGEDAWRSAVGKGGDGEDGGGRTSADMATDGASPVRALDLGSGGGVPGLVLALALPAWRWTLLDGSVKRTTWLEEAVDDLGLTTAVEVVTARAEEAGRSALRGAFDVVVARSFAGPAATAECAAPLLRWRGALVVTEPPGGDPGRWDRTGLERLGMELGVSVAQPVALQVLHQATACHERYPRRTGMPAKRPLW
jgi:16S rRNA (guanine527-N7)-methyltransferase